MGSSSPTQSPSPSETVEPADGKELSTENIMVRMPRGWSTLSKTGTRAEGADKQGLSGGLFLSQNTHVGTTDLDALARTARGNMTYSPPLPKRQDDLTVDGVEGFVLSGVVGDGSYAYEFGTVHEGERVSMTFFFYLPEKKALPVIDSIMASWQWK